MRHIVTILERTHKNVASGVFCSSKFHATRISNVMNMSFSLTLLLNAYTLKATRYGHWTETERIGYRAAGTVKTAGCLEQRLLKYSRLNSGIQYIRMLPLMELKLLARFLSCHVRARVCVCLPACLSVSCPPFNHWATWPVFVKPDMNIMPSEANPPPSISVRWNQWREGWN
jgi:hypothetical protein